VQFDGNAIYFDLFSRHAPLNLLSVATFITRKQRVLFGFMIEKYVDKTRFQKHTASRAQHAQQQQLSSLSHPLSTSITAERVFPCSCESPFLRLKFAGASSRVAEYFSRAKNTKCFKSR
jgi:hypothetical protein